jgi:hypothetical protein
MADGSGEKTKKKAGIELDPTTILIRNRKIEHTPKIAVVDRKLQEMFPTLVVSSTQTVPKEQIGLLRDSEPDVRSNK